MRASDGTNPARFTATLTQQMCKEAPVKGRAASAGAPAGCQPGRDMRAGLVPGLGERRLAVSRWSGQRPG